MHPVKSAVSVATLLTGFVLNAFLYEAAGAQTHQSAYERALQEMQPATGDGRHSLIGTVLSLEPANLDLQARLRSAIQSGSIILAGEVHDNPHAHSLRAALMRDLADRQPLRPALVFEHIKSDQQIGLDLFYEFHAKARRLGHAQDLFRFLEWDRSGWPDKRLFEPLFSAAIFAGFPILPGDVPRERMRTIARGGLTALTDTERVVLRSEHRMFAAATIRQGVLVARSAVV